MSKGSQYERHDGGVVGLRRALCMVAVVGTLLLTFVAAASASPDYGSFYIKGVSTIPGTNYNPVITNEPIDLEGASLSIVRDEGWGCEGRSLPTGQVYTLISTTGGLSGAFKEVSNDEVVDLFPEGDLDCPWKNVPKMQIEYDESGQTQTVTGTVVDGSSTPLSAVSVSGSPSNPVTNQPVTLTATVTTSSDAPSGTVGFLRNAPEKALSIPDCESQPVMQVGSVFEATCQTALMPLPSPDYGPHGPPPLEGVFTPKLGESYTGSQEGTNFTVGPASTTTTVNVSSPTPTVGAGVTYTATVTPAYAGPTMVSGPVEFLDDGQPITSCESQSLSEGESSSSVTCELSYSATGEHNITASYAGDESFVGSSASPAQIVTVQPAATKNSTTGGDKSGVVTTGVASESGGSDHGATVLPTLGDVVLASSDVTVHEGAVARVELHCASTKTCIGKVLLSTRMFTAKKHGHRRSMTLGTASFSIAPGKTLAIKVMLTPTARALLRGDHEQFAASLTVMCAGLCSLPMRTEDVKVVRR